MAFCSSEGAPPCAVSSELTTKSPALIFEMQPVKPPAARVGAAFPKDPSLAQPQNFHVMDAPDNCVIADYPGHACSVFGKHARAAFPKTKKSVIRHRRYRCALPVKQ